MTVRGFINIDKPPGITSFDVVRRIRRAAGIRKVGHAGTLDPAATGVLPIAVGEATKLIDELVDARKRYHATIAFGVATDTYDADGEMVEEHDASSLTREAVEAALAAFRGEIEQTPPAYSAVKRGGVPAYRAARKGDPHDLEPRPVTVHSLSLASFEAGDRATAIVDVECSKGFYVRALAHDLGATLGCGGHLSSLSRTAVGSFLIEGATPLDEAAELLESGASARLVHAPDSVLTAWHTVILGRRQLSEVRHGRDVLAMPRAGYRAPIGDNRARAYGPEGRLVALLERGMVVGSWHPYRVFAPETAAPATV
jgi:tRNA pseudouridine55 synthase